MNFQSKVVMNDIFFMLFIYSVIQIFYSNELCFISTLLEDESLRLEDTEWKNDGEKKLRISFLTKRLGENKTKLKEK